MISGAPYPLPIWSQGKYPLSDVTEKADGEELGQLYIERFLKLLDWEGVTKEALAECWKVQPDTARKKVRAPHRLNRKQVSSLCKLLDMDLFTLQDAISITSAPEMLEAINSLASNLGPLSLQALLKTAQTLRWFEDRLYGRIPNPYTRPEEM